MATRTTFELTSVVSLKWRKKELGIEEKVPKCVNRLMLDSQQRIAQKIRDEN